MITKGTRASRMLEFFKGYNTLKTKASVSHVPRYMYHQHRDWTDHIACLRTLLSYCIPEVPKEDDIIQRYKISPGMKYSADIREWNFLEQYAVDVRYGCIETRIDFDDILKMLQDDYFVMMQTMINYSHWVVLCGYYCLDENDIERNKVLYYCPYYDEIRLTNADEFIEMWVDGAYVNSHVRNDFVAVRDKNGVDNY